MTVLTVLLSQLVIAGELPSPVIQAPSKYSTVYAFDKIFVKKVAAHSFWRFDVCYTEKESVCYFALGNRFLTDDQVREVEKRLNQQLSAMNLQLLRNAYERDAMDAMWTGLNIIQGRYQRGAELIGGINAIQFVLYEGSVPTNKAFPREAIHLYERL